MIAGPVAPTVAWKLGDTADDPIANYLADIYTLPASLAGLPGMSVPAGFGAHGMPVGLQLIGNYFDEARLLNVAHRAAAGNRLSSETARGNRAMTTLSSDSKLVRGWEVVIGFETHAQLSTQAKMFSRAATAFGAEPNTQACAVDLALPGTLPVPNRGAVERAIVFGLAIGAHIAPRSVFARKNYFYPDLPKGYQISQFELPVVQGGGIEFEFEGRQETVRLVRAHLEEDAGKSLHEDFRGRHRHRPEPAPARRCWRS